MKRVIFLSKSKLAANLLKFLLSESPLDCVCISDENQLNNKLFAQKKLLILLDHSFLTKLSSDHLQLLNPKNLEKSQKLFFLQDENSTNPLPFTAHESIIKPFLADELMQKIGVALGVDL